MKIEQNPPSALKDRKAFHYSSVKTEIGKRNYECHFVTALKFPDMHCHFTEIAKIWVKLPSI